MFPEIERAGRYFRIFGPHCQYRREEIENTQTEKKT
jgi:hypothetical protein